MAITALGAEVTTATPVGPGASDPLNDPTPTQATVTLSVSPTAISPCQPVVISWTVDNMPAITGSTLTLMYSNIGVLQTGGGTTYNPPQDEQILAVAPVGQGSWTWDAAPIRNSGFYVIMASGSSSPQPLVKQTEPFLVTVGDSSCQSSTSALPTGTVAPSLPSQPASSETTTLQPTSSGPQVGPIIGGAVAAIAVVGLIVAFLLCRRRRNVISKNTNQRAVPGKGHQRKWGGLASIDKLEGEIPVVMPGSNKSPYGNQAYNRTRSRSTGRAMTDEEGMEKGYSKDTFPVDADLLSEMPTLDSKRTSQRYSSDFVNTALRQNSGLAAFNDEHPRSRALPVLSTTTATSSGSEDPFSDAAFIARGNRSSTLSVPSTARAPSRVSDISGRGAPSPTVSPVSPVQSQPPSQANTISRNASATANMGRPSRKPVPQYTDDSIELSRTSRASPTSQGFPSRNSSGPAPGSSTTDLSSSATSYDALASSADSQTHWLHAHRVAVANRNIGLAGQGDGPVHYLMPDLPPPAR